MAVFSFKVPGPGHLILFFFLGVVHIHFTGVIYNLHQIQVTTRTLGLVKCLKTAAGLIRFGLPRMIIFKQSQAVNFVIYIPRCSESFWWQYKLWCISSIYIWLVRNTLFFFIFLFFPSFSLPLVFLFFFFLWRVGMGGGFSKGGYGFVSVSVSLHMREIEVCRGSEVLKWPVIWNIHPHAQNFSQRKASAIWAGNYHSGERVLQQLPRATLSDQGCDVSGNWRWRSDGSSCRSHYSAVTEIQIHFTAVIESSGWGRRNLWYLFGSCCYTECILTYLHYV